MIAAPPSASRASRCDLEANRTTLIATSNFLTCGFGTIFTRHWRPWTEVEHVGAELLELARTDARDGDQRGVVGGQRLGDGDQRVVGEHHIRGHVHLLGGPQPPVLEVGRAVRSSMSDGQRLAAAQHDRRRAWSARRCRRGTAARATRLARPVRAVGAASCGAMPLRKRDGRAALPTARSARQRPAERQMHSGPGDSDVEQATLLFDGLTVRAVRQRMRDGQRAVGETDQEHRVPLQALGGVQRRQRDALHDGWVAGVGALPQFGDQAAGPASGRSATSSSTSSASATSASHRSRAWVPDGGSAVSPSGSSSCAHQRPADRRPSRQRHARPRAAAPAAPAGSPGG